MHVLVADDHQQTRQLLVRILKVEGHDVAAVGSCAAVHNACSGAAFDVLVLDVRLPDGSGITLCSQLRAANLRLPILLLTGRGEVQDRVSGLEAGADDYLAKPFGLADLRARINALARRGPVVRNHSVKIGPLVVDFEARLVRCNGIALPLTVREVAIVEMLAGRHRRVTSRERLIESIWGEDPKSVRAGLDVLVARIRRKLGASAGLLRSIRGGGYVLGESE
jgi:DNA-binding response OmpR family regulator